MQPFVHEAKTGADGKPTCSCGTTRPTDVALRQHAARANYLQALHWNKQAKPAAERIYE